MCAKIKLTAFMDGISGKVNGSVFSKNRYGSYVRSKSRFKAGTELPDKVNLPTPSVTSTNKAVFAMLSTSWRSLTNAERISWINAASEWATTDQFGDLRTPTGFNVFMRVNGVIHNTTNGSGTLLSVAPIKVDVPELSYMQAEFLNNETAPDVWESIASFQFSPLSADIVIPANQVYVMQATRPMSQGKSYVGDSDFRIISKISGTLTGGSVDISSDYQTTFGYGTQQGSDVIYPVPSKIFIRGYVVDIETGQKSVPAEWSVFVQENPM